MTVQADVTVAPERCLKIARGLNLKSNVSDVALKSAATSVSASAVALKLDTPAAVTRKRKEQEALVEEAL